MPRWESSIAQAMPVGPAPTIATGGSEGAIARFYSAAAGCRKNVTGTTPHRHDSAFLLGAVSRTRLYRGVTPCGAAWRRLCEFPFRQLFPEVLENAPIRSFSLSDRGARFFLDLRARRWRSCPDRHQPRVRVWPPACRGPAPRS